MEHSSSPCALIVHNHFPALFREQLPDIDDEAHRDTLGGWNLLDTVAIVLRSQVDDLRRVVARPSRLVDMQDRLSRIEGRAAKKRMLVASVTGRAVRRKLSDIPTDRALQPPRLYRGALLAGLKGGGRIPRASLGNEGVTLAARPR